MFFAFRASASETAQLFLDYRPPLALNSRLPRGRGFRGARKAIIPRLVDKDMIDEFHRIKRLIAARHGGQAPQSGKAANE